MVPDLGYYGSGSGLIWFRICANLDPDLGLYGSTTILLRLTNYMLTKLLILLKFSMTKLKTKECNGISIKIDEYVLYVLFSLVYIYTVF